MQLQSVIDMSIGEVAKIHCTPDYAYGAGGFPAWGIQPNSELVSETCITEGCQSTNALCMETTKRKIDATA